MAESKHNYVKDLQGIGEVYKGDNKLAKVRYTLDIQQEILKTRSFKDTQYLEGLSSTTGSIYVIEGKNGLLETGKKLTMHIYDDKKFDFFVINGDVNTGKLFIKLSGSFYY